MHILSGVELQKKFLTEKSSILFQAIGAQQGLEEPIAIARFKSKDKVWYALEYMPAEQTFFGYMDDLSNPENSNSEIYFTLGFLQEVNAKFDRAFEPCPLYEYLVKNWIKTSPSCTGKIFLEIGPGGMIINPLF